MDHLLDRVRMHATVQCIFYMLSLHVWNFVETVNYTAPGLPDCNFSELIRCMRHMGDLVNLTGTGSDGATHTYFCDALTFGKWNLVCSSAVLKR